MPLLKPLNTLKLNFRYVQFSGFQCFLLQHWRHLSHPLPCLQKKAFQQLSTQFDGHNGGFGNRSKFPTPHNLVFLLRYWKRTEEKRALEMVEKTLKRGAVEA